MGLFGLSKENRLEQSRSCLALPLSLGWSCRECLGAAMCESTLTIRQSIFFTTLSLTHGLLSAAVRL